MDTLEKLISRQKIDMSVYEKEIQALFSLIAYNEDVAHLCKDCTVTVAEAGLPKRRLALVAVTPEQIAVGCHDCSYTVRHGELTAVSYRDMAGGAYCQIILATHARDIALLVNGREGKKIAALLTALGFGAAVGEDKNDAATQQPDNRLCRAFGKDYRLDDEDIRVMAADLENLSQAMLSCRDMYSANHNDINLSVFEKYYQPAARGLIETYARRCAKNEEGESFALYEKKVREALSRIRDNFASVYANMFNEQALDIRDDISRLKQSFAEDGLLTEPEISDKEAPPEEVPFEIVVVRDSGE